MSFKALIGLITTCLLLFGCSSFEFSKSLRYVSFWNSVPETYCLGFEVLDDDDTLKEYSRPRTSINADELLLELDTNITRSDQDSLSARLTNNRSTSIQILNPGSFDGDYLVEFLAIEKNGNVVHRFGPFRVYSKESVGTFDVAPGDHYQKTISIDAVRFQAPGFESVEVDKPLELVIVAKFEQPASYDQPQIGPLFSLPKKFRVTKYKTD